MNRVTSLLRSEDLTVFRFDHPPGPAHRDPPEEISGDYSISFVEQGVFSIAVGRRAWRLDPGSVFLAPPGLSFKCSHEETHPCDVCLSVVYAPALIQEYRERFSLPRVPPVFSAGTRLGYLSMRLSGLLAGGDALGAEETATQILENLEGNRGRENRGPTHQHTLRWYAERVDSARALMERDYGEALSLSGLARSSGMSVFHFARVFASLTGVPPHRYLRDVRLDRAAERLRAGDTVTQTCFAVGFNNLSHFIRTFRCRFGIPPRSWAKGRATKPAARK